MPKKKMLVEWEDGADLSQSRKKPGGFSPLTRDDDNNLGQVILSYVDEDEEAESELEALIGALAVLGVIVAAQKAAPHLRRWWNDQAVPFLKKSRNSLSKDRRSRGQGAAEELSTLAQSVPTESSQEVFAALEEYRTSMSKAEARERFVAALVARLFSDEQLRVLRNARMEDEGPASELASAMETLTPEQLGESITLMLEANPSWPDEETLAELGKILGRSSQGAGEYVPVRRAQINRALRPPRSGE